MDHPVRSYIASRTTIRQSTDPSKHIHQHGARLASASAFSAGTRSRCSRRRACDAASCPSSAVCSCARIADDVGNPSVGTPVVASRRPPWRDSPPTSLVELGCSLPHGSVATVPASEVSLISLSGEALRAGACSFCALEPAIRSSSGIFASGECPHLLVYLPQCVLRLFHT